MKRKFHLLYFTLSFSETCKSKPILILILVIDQLTLLLETVKSTAIGINIFYRTPSTLIPSSQLNSEYYPNNFSLLFNFRRIIPNTEPHLYPTFLYILVNIFLLLYLSFPIIQLFHPHRIINLIIINFYDLFFFRFLSIIILDIIVNFASYSQHQFITNAMVNGMISAIIIILTIIIYMNYYQLVFIYLKYNDKMSYRFDFLSVNDNCLMFISKCLIVTQNNLIYKNYNEMVILFLSFVIFVFSFMSLFWNMYFIKVYPCLVCHNFLYHKLRVSFQICTAICLICVLFDIYKNKEFYYILFITAIVFSCLCFYGIKMDFFENMVMNGMDEKNHLAKILQLKYMNNIHKQRYIERIMFHVFKCNNCEFCNVYKHEEIDLKIVNDDEVNNVLFTIYKLFLVTYTQRILRKDKHKSILHNKNVYDFSYVVYDLFYLLSFSFHNNYNTYDFLSYMYYIKKKYLYYNDPVSINLHLIQHEVFQNGNQNTTNENEDLEKNKILIKELSIYISFLDKFTKIIKSIQEFIPRETKTPKQFLNLGYELQNLNSEDSKQFLLNNKKSSKFNGELLTFLLEEITNEPINKERGFVKQDISLSEDLLNYHFNNNQNIIMLYDAKVNQAYIKKTGKDMIHYLNEELSELFPYELREEGKRQFKYSLNYDSDIKHFEFILYKNKLFPKGEECPFKNNKYVRFDLQYKLYYESLENDLVFLINGEYKFDNDEIVITKTKINNSYNNKEHISHYKYDFLMNNNEHKIEDESKDNLKGTILFKFNTKVTVVQNPIIEYNHKEMIHAITLNDFDINKLPKYITHNKNCKLKEIELNSMFFQKGGKLYIHPFLNECFIVDILHTQTKKHNNKNKKTKKKTSLQFTHVLTINTEYYVYKVYSTKKTLGEIQKEKIMSKKSTMFINAIAYDISSTNSNNDDIEINKANVPDASTFAESNSSVNISSNVKKDKSYLKIKSNDDKHFNQVQSRFITIIKFTFGFCLIIIIYNIITLIIELQWNNKLIEIYDIYTELRGLNRIFYNVAISILAVICIAKSPTSTECVNYYKQYNDKFNEFYNISYNAFEFASLENTLKVNTFATRFRNIRRSMFNLNDKEVTDLINSEFVYSSLSIVDNEIQVFEKNISFVLALEMLLNSLIVIIEDKTYLSQPVYIFTLSTYDFSNVYNKDNLTDAQVSYYNSVMNYGKFLYRWEEIQKLLSSYSNNIIRQIKILVTIFICIGSVFHVLLVILVYNFIKNFENLFILNTNQLMKKFDTEIYLKFYKVKFENLSILAKLYEKNPNSLIKVLSKAYSEFTKEFTLQKARENHTDKSLIPSLTNEFSSSLNLFKSNNNSEEITNYFPLRQYRRISNKFFILIFFILFYYLLILLIFLTVWISQMDDINYSFTIINEYTLSACSGYNLFSLCEIMLLTNQTHQEVSNVMEHNGTYYIYEESVRSISNIIYTVEQSKKLGGLIRSTSDFLDLDCDTFLLLINDTRTEQLDQMYPEYKFKERYPEFCKVFQIHRHKEELLFYTNIFYEINKLANSIVVRKEYKDVIYYLENSNVYFLCNLEIFLYRHFISWFNNNIITDAVNRNMNREQLLLYTILMVSIFSEVWIFVLLYFQVFHILKKLNNTLGCVSNAFNVIR